MKKIVVFEWSLYSEIGWSLWTGKCWSVCSEMGGHFRLELGGQFDRFFQFKYLADVFEPQMDNLKKHGAENWWIEIGRLYAHQCNEELDCEELKQISRLNCSLTYSAYSVSEEEENEGFDYENYDG